VRLALKVDARVYALIRQHGQVLRVVISWITIDVMHHLSAIELSPNCQFCYRAVGMSSIELDVWMLRAFASLLVPSTPG
jgi:hypothetical protein